MKFRCNFFNHSNKHDWIFNILPYFSIGNNEWNDKSCVINLGWGLWCLFIEISWNKLANTENN